MGWPRWRQQLSCSGKQALLVGWVRSEREKGVGGVQLKPEFLRQEEPRWGWCCRWPPYWESGFSGRVTWYTRPSSAEVRARDIRSQRRCG